MELAGLTLANVSLASAATGTANIQGNSHILVAYSLRVNYSSPSLPTAATAKVTATISLQVLSQPPVGKNRGSLNAIRSGEPRRR
ncbi:Uncharacterised protein [Serratia proteamaculans]|nr:Uncharacterised protein [Serratia proteamaculans]